MRIEEMRISPELLGRRSGMQAAQPQRDHEAEIVENDVLTLHPRSEVAADQSCDLSAFAWSVVCFEGIEAGGLTYVQAVRLMAELDTAGVPGLCIVTDSAARRIS